MSTPSPSSDRNLLFGILALQVNFISRDALIKGMNAWVLEKHRPLGEILGEQGALSPQRRDLLEAMLCEHLKVHDDDAQKSLAALWSVRSVRSDLAGIADSDVQTTVGHMVGAAAEETEWGMTEAYAPPTTPHAVRYKRLRPHARGGLGEVFVALDEELNREVALKEIQNQHADHGDSRARFLLEAKVTGKLEHPGVVPVYGLGVYPDGRPYYAMRFIQGDNLKDAIDRYHDPQAQGLQSLGFHSLPFRGLLERFLDVCDAVAYAHSRGVLHRDLKPANVMLGRYGETLVVDWGLAKLLGRPEPAVGEDVPLMATLSGDATPTQAGRVVGTPEYMSPEQAAGQLDLLGPATDVYSLGAMLYCLLTGRPPFVRGKKEDLGEVLRKVEACDFPPPRQVKSSVPRPLEAICRKAMARRVEDRYASVEALGQDVRQWLADEVVSAYREPMADRLRRWGRRHRTLATSLVVLLLTATAALGVGLLFVNTARRATQNVLEEKTDALERSDKSEKSAREQRQLALNTVRRVVYEIHAQLKDRPGQKELRKALLVQALGGLKEVARAADTSVQVDHETIWVHLELGDLFLKIEEGGTMAAKKQYERAQELAQQLVDADPQSTEAQRDLSISYVNLGDTQMQLGDSKAALASYQQGLALRERLTRADPQSAVAQRDLSVSYHRLGNVQLQLGDSKAALTAYQQSVALAERLARADLQNAQAQRDLAASCTKVGDVQMRRGDSKAALASYQQSMAIHEQLARADPQSAEAQRNLSISYNRLGEVQMQLGDTKAALTACQQSLAVAERLVKADPQNAQAQRDLSFGYEKLGDVQMQLRDSKAALASYQQSLAVAERLAKADPQSAQAQRDLSVSYSKLGDVQMRLGDRKALASYQQSLELLQRLAKADPLNAEAQRDLSLSYYKLGDMQMRLGESKAALASYQQSLVLTERLARADPQNPQAQRDLLVSYHRLGNLQQQAGEFDKAAQWYAKAIDVPRRFSRPDFFKQEVGVLDNSLRFCRAAADALVDPASALKQPEALRLRVLGVVSDALARQKKADKALTAAELLAANAKGPGHLYDAACTYALCVSLADVAAVKEKRAARAVELLRQAVARGYTNAAHMKRDTDLDVLRGRDDFKKLLGEMEAAAAAKKAKAP
jgi:serine/threonine-protein kinase